MAVFISTPAPLNKPTLLSPSMPPSSSPNPSTPSLGAGTLRIPDQVARTLSETVTRAEETADNLRQRADRRRALPDGVRVIAQVSQVGGTCQTQVACVRDLSAGGLALLWGTFLHNDTRCSFTVVNSETHEPVTSVSGVVVRCTHVKGSVHDVGVKFDEPIDMGCIPGATPEAAQAAASLEELAKDLLSAIQSRAETRRISAILVRLTEDLKTARGLERNTPGKRVA
ncbi:MAG: PilZ domain-containing protein [Phycisphaerales bacterium]